MANKNKKEFLLRIKKLKEQLERNDRVIKALSYEWVIKDFSTNGIVDDLSYKNHAIEMELLYLEIQLEAKKSMNKWY